MNFNLKTTDNQIGPFGSFEEAEDYALKYLAGSQSEHDATLFEGETPTHRYVKTGEKVRRTPFTPTSTTESFRLQKRMKEARELFTAKERVYESLRLDATASASDLANAKFSLDNAKGALSVATRHHVRAFTWVFPLPVVENDEEDAGEEELEVCPDCGEKDWEWEDNSDPEYHQGWAGLRDREHREWKKCNCCGERWGTFENRHPDVRRAESKHH